MPVPRIIDLFPYFELRGKFLCILSFAISQFWKDFCDRLKRPTGSNSRTSKCDRPEFIQLLLFSSQQNKFAIQTSHILLHTSLSDKDEFLSFCGNESLNTPFPEDIGFQWA